MSLVLIFNLTGCLFTLLVMSSEGQVYFHSDGVRFLYSSVVFACSIPVDKQAPYHTCPFYVASWIVGTVGFRQLLHG